LRERQVWEDSMEFILSSESSGLQMQLSALAFSFLIDQYLFDQRLPFGLQARSGHRSPSLTIPIAGVPEIAFLPVEVGMDQGRLWAFYVLYPMVGSFPVPGTIVPKRFGERG